jgi:hypothetical protein
VKLPVGKRTSPVIANTVWALATAATLIQSPGRMEATLDGLSASMGVPGGSTRSLVAPLLLSVRRPAVYD